jgi:hypothetical protein
VKYLDLEAPIELRPRQVWYLWACLAHRGARSVPEGPQDLGAPQDPEVPPVRLILEVPSDPEGQLDRWGRIHHPHRHCLSVQEGREDHQHRRVRVGLSNPADRKGPVDLSDLVGRGYHLLRLDRLGRSIPVGLGHLEDLVGPEHHPYLQVLQALADPHDPGDQELRQHQQVQQGP